MRQTLAALVALATLAGGTLLLAQGSRALDVQLKAAQHKAEVEGDLRGAIDMYRVVTEGSDRALAARAWLLMAETHQKLGDAEAQAIYQRVLREYTDQPTVVSTARSRLSTLGAAAAAKSIGMTSRRLWTPGYAASFGTISRDGRYLPYTDWSTSQLVLHDFRTGTDRPLTARSSPLSADLAEESAISRDGRYAAYSWWNQEIKNYELRVVSLDGNGLPEPRVLVRNADIGWLAPADWSPDGRWIAVTVSRVDRTTQFALVSVADGSLHVLKSARWQGADEIFFSPDGKYLAFDSPTGDAQEPSDVFVLELDLAGDAPAVLRETAVVVSPSHEILMGWSPDGNQLFFASDRGGATGLWSQSLAGGRPVGAPRQIRSELPSESLGVTDAGTMFLRASAGEQDLYMATVDFATGRVLEPPVSPVVRYVGTNRSPAFSPDGRQLAYVSLRRTAGATTRAVLVIHSFETGETRDLDPPDLNYFQLPQWSPDSLSVIARGGHVNGKGGIHRIDARTGAVKTIAEPGVGVKISPDAQRLYYRGDNVIVERNLSTGSTRELLRGNANQVGLPSLSPDGTQVAVQVEDTARRVSTLLLVPVAGGEPRELARFPVPDIANGLSWTPDGRRLLVRTGPPADVSSVKVSAGVWIVPVDGGPHIRLQLPESLGNSFEQIAVHPDGRRIAFVAGEQRGAVEVLENFLPSATAN